MVNIKRLEDHLMLLMAYYNKEKRSKSAKEFEALHDAQCS